MIAESHEANFCCDECSKVCKTQRGLTRHKNTKHSSSRSSGVPVSSETIIEKKLHADVLLRIVNECAESCFNDLCLPQESRDFFSKKNFVFTSENSLQLLQKLKYIVECHFRKVRAGYIVHKMYTKFKFSNNYKSDHSQQTLSILKACKVEHDDSQTLVNLNP